MKILIFANKFDEDDDLLGFFVGWVVGLARNFERVTVITQYAGRHPSLENLAVFSLDKERTKSRPARLIDFYRYLWGLKNDYDTAFIFMAPAWAIAVWPVLKILRKKTVLWYAVWKDSLKLRLATLLSDKVVSSVSRAFPFKTKKLILAGQGIDVSYFRPDESRRDPNRILFLGRISAIKRIEILLEALKMIKSVSPAIYDRITVDIVGGPSPEKNSEYLDELKTLASNSGIAEKLRWMGKVSHRNVLPYYQKAGIFVNLTPTGSFDKTMLEAMACGDFILASNKALEEFFDESAGKLFLYKENDAGELAAKLVHLLSSSNQLAGWRTGLRNIVTKYHSQENLVNNLSQIFKSLGSAGNAL